MRWLPADRPKFELRIDDVRPIVLDIDKTFEALAATRLVGGSGDIYRIDLHGGAAHLILKIYADEPEWAPAKEAMVGGWLDRDLGVSVPRWLALDESRTRLSLRFAVMTWLPGAVVRDLVREPDVNAI